MAATIITRLFRSPSQKIFLFQFFRYALIGILTNVAGYVVYLAMTSHGLPPKSTVTILYGVGASINFWANRRFTFRHDGSLGQAGVRYLWVQLAGYLMNLLILALFVDWLGLPHQYVQAAAIVVVALFLFALSRFFVFVPDHSGKNSGS